MPDYTNEEKQDRFVEFLFMSEEEGGAGGDPIKAKVMAGYDPAYSTRVLLSSKSMQEKIEKAVKEYFTEVAPKSVMSIMAVLKNPATPGSAMKLKAATELLDRGGFVKTEKIDVNTSGGLFILPPKDTDNE
jgi:hypothetical protein